MATAVSICSNALQELGAAAIASFDDTNDRARLCANLYPTAKGEVLRAHAWRCARRRVQLSPLATVPAYGKAHAFQLPGDWVRTLKVGGFNDYPVEFQHEGRQLLSDASPLYLRYVSNLDNEGTWDDLLVSVMQMRMKWALCYPVTKSTSLRTELREEFRGFLKQAKSIDSMGEPPEMLAEQSPLIAARY